MTKLVVTATTYHKPGEPLVTFDEQAFIEEVLNVITDLHGSYNSTDQRLVKQLASFQRSFEIADANLLMPNNHLTISNANGALPSAWFRLRESSMASILKIRKDLGLDIFSRDPITSGRQANEPLFNAKFKEEKEFVRR